MNPLSRRAFSTILIAALLSGAAPSGAQAQVARVAGQAAGTGATPVVISPAGMSTVPAFETGAASLNGTLSPSVAPSPVPSGWTAVSPSASLSAPALSASVLAAASQEAPERPDVPAAAEPAAKSWGQRVAGVFRRPASAPAPAREDAAPEAAKAGSDLAFDGAAEKSGDVAGPALAGSDGVRPSGLRAPASAAPAKRPARVDEFGGPPAAPMTFKQRVGYGVHQGVNLVGVAAILEVTLRPLLSVFPWVHYVSEHTLRGFGRVALLTQYGPNEIIAGLADSPARFLAVSLPMAVTMEEVTYRLIGFGATFLALAAIKPLTRWLSSMITGLPDAAGAVSGVQRALKLGGLASRFAFPTAAALSAAYFAVAHFGAWGFSPFILALNFIVGLSLARVAYKSRGLTAPIVAHLVFNLVTMGAILTAMMFSPLAGGAFTIIAGLIGAASLLHGWVSARRERAFRPRLGAKALIAVLIAGASLATWQGGLKNVPGEMSARYLSHPAAPSVQDTMPMPMPLPQLLAQLSERTIESRADMVERVKPSVVNVIVHMPGGYAIGSGFILTPGGVFVTNGHVVGDKKPGEFVNARVAGVKGELRAKVLAVNHDKDLAIVQLQRRPDGKPWPTVKLAEQAPREGDDVTALGFPRGQPFTVSHGVVSGVDGRGNMYVRKLQTDAAINPGNSGGPLFNDQGEVIGVNTEILTQSGGSEGLGFSIQAPEVARVMAQYAKTGNIATASLGISVNLSDPLAPEAGLEIEYVRSGSAADKAGLRRGDLLIGVGEESIDEGGQEAVGHVAYALAKMIPGQKTTITVLRGDSPLELTLVADAKVTEAPRH